MDYAFYFIILAILLLVYFYTYPSKPSGSTQSDQLDDIPDEPINIPSTNPSTSTPSTSTPSTSTPSISTSTPKQSNDKYPIYDPHEGDHIIIKNIISNDSSSFEIDGISEHAFGNDYIYYVKYSTARQQDFGPNICDQYGNYLGSVSWGMPPESNKFNGSKYTRTLYERLPRSGIEVPDYEKDDQIIKRIINNPNYSSTATEISEPRHDDSFVIQNIKNSAQATFEINGIHEFVHNNKLIYMANYYFPSNIQYYPPGLYERDGLFLGDYETFRGEPKKDFKYRDIEYVRTLYMRENRPEMPKYEFERKFERMGAHWMELE